MQEFTLMARGPFSLAVSTRFIEGFTPAAFSAPLDRPLELAFAVEGTWQTVGVRLTEHGDQVTGEVVSSAALDADVLAAVRRQVERILSLDVDGSGFLGVGERDPVIAGLQRRYPGLRPVGFWSPYEAAAWAVIGQRIRIRQAAAVKARMAERLGEAVAFGDHVLHAFPAPQRLAGLEQFPALTGRKPEWLRAVARAALDGRLDAARPAVLRRAVPAGAQGSAAAVDGRRARVGRGHLGRGVHQCRPDRLRPRRLSGVDAHGRRGPLRRREGRGHAPLPQAGEHPGRTGRRAGDEQRADDSRTADHAVLRRRVHLHAQAVQLAVADPLPARRRVRAPDRRRPHEGTRHRRGRRAVHGVPVFAAGLQFLLLSCIIYAPGTVLFVMTRREQGRRVFSTGELVLCLVTVVGAVLGIAGLATGRITI